MPDAEPEFERRVWESRRMVYQVAYSVLANAADAEQVTQGVFLRAFRKLGGLREPERFRGWVARMSWRLALNRRRSLARALRRDGAWLLGLAAPREDAEALAAGNELQARLREEIPPDKLRAALLLSAIEGLDARSVSAILRIPEGTVRSRLHLARRRLLERLSP